MIRTISLLILTISLVSCTSEYPGVPDKYHSKLDSALVRAGENSAQISLAIQNAPGAQKEGMAYLVSYMPERDLTTLSSEFLLENAKYAYLAREEFDWCRKLPDSVFFNEVLPYANITEKRENWRADFYKRFSAYVKDADNMIDALFAINSTINKEVDVEYNTKRRSAVQGPYESMEQHMATCTGLSIILTDAFRSVGIPSRLAGTPLWTNMRGNHTWSEVLVDGEWMFTEYYPDTLNRSWFVADAGKADPEDPKHWIYAVSYKETDLPYPTFRRGNEEGKIETFGINVTQRYIDLYRSTIKEDNLKENEIIVGITVYSDRAKGTTSEERISCLVEAFQDDKRVDFGYSPRPVEDMNKMLKFRLNRLTEYTIKLTDSSIEKVKTVTITTDDSKNQVIELFLE